LDVKVLLQVGVGFNSFSDTFAARRTLGAFFRVDGFLFFLVVCVVVILRSTLLWSSMLCVVLVRESITSPLTLCVVVVIVVVVVFFFLGCDSDASDALRFFGAGLTGESAGASGKLLMVDFSCDQHGIVLRWGSNTFVGLVVGMLGKLLNWLRELMPKGAVLLNMKKFLTGVVGEEQLRFENALSCCKVMLPGGGGSDIRGVLMGAEINVGTTSGEVIGDDFLTFLA